MCLTLPSEYDTIHSRSWESRPRAGRIEARRPVRSRGEPSLEGLRGSPAVRRCPRACRLRQPVAATGASAPGHAAGHRRDPARDHGRLASPGGSGLARDASAVHGSMRRRVAPERSRGRPERRRHRPGTLGCSASPRRLSHDPPPGGRLHGGCGAWVWRPGCSRSPAPAATVHGGEALSVCPPRAGVSEDSEAWQRGDGVAPALAWPRNRGVT
jgi:hypothetical protein